MRVLQIDNFAGKPDFSPGWGFLYVLQMPAGNYFMQLGAMNPYDRYTGGSQALGFSVAAGAKTYLGEAYFFRTRDGGKIVSAIPHKGEVF